MRLHESVKVELETYARQVGERIVKPFMLVIARDTAHAAELMQLIKSSSFFEGRYTDKVIQVDSSVKEEETIERLLKVEQTDEPTEIVIHVNMLKEGWDVTNLYTIMSRFAPPMLAHSSSNRSGADFDCPMVNGPAVTAVDRLNIVAHDRFQEIVDEAKKPGSAIRLQQVILTNDQLQQKTVTVVSQPQLASKLGFLQPDGGETISRKRVSRGAACFQR